MSKKFTPGQTTANGCTQSPAPVFYCVNTTAKSISKVYNSSFAKYCNASDANLVIASVANLVIASEAKQWSGYRRKNIAYGYYPLPVVAQPGILHVKNSIDIVPANPNLATQPSPKFNTSCFMKKIFTKSGMLAMMLMMVSLFVSMKSTAQLLNGGLRSPSTNAGVTSVTNPANGYSSNNSDAIFTVNGSTVRYGGFALTADNAGPIPVTAGIKIVGIEVLLEGARAGDRNLNISLTWDNGTSFTTAQAMPGFPVGTDGVSVVGGVLNTWGRTWTAAELSNANFGVRCSVPAAATGDIDLDHVQVRVYYNFGTVTSFATTNTFTVPVGVTSITVEAWGGGGKGSTGSSDGEYGGGGGGAYARSVLTVVPGQVYDVIVGTGSSTTASGTDSRFRLQPSGGDLVRASGGGSVANNTTAGALGGTAASSVGDIKFNGGRGGNSTNNQSAGGGGSSGGTGSDGVYTASTNSFNGGVTAGAGAGGNGSLTDDVAGSPGVSPGGGGSGVRRNNGTVNGGNGANGAVLITYCFAYTLSSTTAATPICTSPSTSLITLTSTAAGLPVDNYTVTYSRSSPAATGLTTTMTVTSAGTGSFTATGFTSGNSTVTITNITSNSLGCSSAITSGNVSNTIVVNPTPTIDAAATATSVCYSASDQITPLTYTATNTPATYSITWNASPTNTFAPVTDVAIPNPTSGTINITVPGGTNPGLTPQTYTGTITVKSAANCVSTSDNFTVTVNPSLTPSVSLAGPPGNSTCSGVVTPFTATASNTNGATVTYTFYQDAVIVQNTTANIYNAPAGSLTSGNVIHVEIGLTGGTGCFTSTTATSNSITVTVNPTPSAPTGPTGAEVCGSGSMAISVNDPGTGLTIDWYAASSGGSVLSGGTGTVSYSTPSISSTTIYYAQTRDIASGCVSLTRTAVTATVHPLPTASIAPATVVVCSGGSATLTGSATGGSGSGYLYSWDGGAFTADNTLILTNITSTASHTLAVRDGFNCVSATVSRTVTVNTVAAGTINANSAADLNPACGSLDPGNTQNTAAGTGSGTITYRWEQSVNLGGSYTTVAGATGTQFNPSALSQTTYYRRVAISTLSGVPCEAVSNVLMYVVNPLPATVVVTGGGTSCVSATLNASNGGSGTIYYQGTNATGTSTATPSMSQVVTSAGTYYFRALSAEGCWGVAGSAVVVINTPPVTTGVIICQGVPGQAMTSSTTCLSGGSVTGGPNFAGAGATSGSGTAWTTPGNITSDNNSYATVAGTGTAFSQALNATSFGFGIPTNATIGGIQVTISRFRSTGFSGEIQDNSVRLIRGGTVSGNNNGATTTNWPSSEAAANYGGTTDLWGLTGLTASEINASNFGVSLVVDNTSGTFSRQANVDFIQITVTYSLPGSMNWYTVSSGGSPVQSNTTSFNPIGDPEVIASGAPYSNLSNTNTTGTYNFWAECSTVPGCRTLTTFVINAKPNISDYPAAITICADQSATLTGTASGGAIQWTASSGANAGVFSAPNSFQTFYTPSATDIANGSVTATITLTDGTTGCVNTLSIPITINNVLVDAGPATLTICSSQAPINLNGTVSGAGVTGGTWTTNGTGTFGNANLLATTYTPGPEDIGNPLGVILTLTTNDPAGPCDSKFDEIQVTIKPSPAVPEIGGPTTLCPSASDITYYISNADANTVYTWEPSAIFTQSNLPGDGEAIANFGPANNTIVNVTVTASLDGCNTSSAVYPVTIADNTAPVPNIASLAVITGECSATVIAAPTATDNCTGSVTGTTTDPLSYNTDGTYTITWNYNDGNGNTSTQTQTVIVDDITAPVPNVASLPNLTGECGATATAPTATDNCAGTITATTTDPTTYTADGTYTITWTYNDGRGNTSSQTQTVIVDDITAPVPNVASLPNLTGECGATATAPTATDNCAGTITATTTDPVSYSAQGTYTITWTYNDGRGNTSSQTQTVVIDDITAPVPNVASLPAITGECSAAVIAAPTATDNCVGAVTATTTDPTSYSLQGTYTITWTYNDGNGNTSSQTQTVIVDDITAPVPDVASLPAITGECSAAVISAPTATDACVGAVTATTTDPTSYITQGTFTITWTYNDGNGNTSSQTQTVIVDDITAPVANVASLPTVTGECGATATAPTATDNCVGTLTATTTDPTTYTTQGTFTITWTYNDGNGNTSSQTQTVVVDDITAPVADVASLPTLTGQCSVTATAPTATDNCEGPITGTTTDPLTYTTDGTYTITWTYDDGNGNTSSQTQTVIVDDITAPVPNVASLPTITGECAASVVAPTATDNCAGIITATTTDPTSYNADGTYTITWTYNDGRGNTSSQTQTVIVDDITAPVPDVASLPTVTEECSASVTAPTATDNCVGPVTATTTDPTSYSAQGTYTITWTYNDGNGNTSSQTQTVIVDDITAPVPNVASLPTVTGECGATVTAPTATDNCVGAVTATTTDPTSYTTQGTFTINWTYNDGNGNTSSQTQTVIVDDITAPVPDVASLPAITGECSAAVIAAPTATDNCVGTVTATTTDPLSYSVQGTYTITWTYNDGNGNTSSQTQTVIVDDITAPVANVASLPTVTGECGATATAPTATDNCVGTVTATTTDPTSYTTQGTFTITWTYNDGNGNTSSQTQTVIVDDITAPVADVASLPTVTGQCSATVTAPTATDNCEGTITGTTSDPLTYNVDGTYTITWTYDDGNGNTSSQTQTVIVDDITAPVPNVASLPTITGECAASVVAPTATDNCAGIITATTTDPTSYNADGTYTITWTYNDGRGNTSSQTQTVIVDDITAPVPDVASLPTVTEECSASVTAPTATDNCVGPVTATTTDPTSYPAQGTYTITWTYNDGNGNTSSQTQTVIVDDITAPVADVASLPTVTGECGATVTAPTATDNCVGAVTATTTDPTSYTTQGTFTITWTYNDGNGNTSSQTQTVIVDDITAPVPNVALLPVITGECSAAVIAAPTATDNCVGSVTATTTDPTSYTLQGTYTITWTYNDGNGNTSSQTQTVIVDDITAPVADVASLPTVTGECSATVTAPTATDNCVGTVTGTTSDPTSYTAQGTYTITWTYNDGNGNTSSQTQTVIVDDITAPVADVASLPTVTGQCSATVTAPTATDNCEGTITGTTSDPLTYNVDGTYTITWTYDDGNGNTSSQTQTVIVDDNTAPVPNVASLPTITGECAASVVAPTATDNCAGIITATTTDPTSYNADGTYTITWTYNDGRGNTSSQTQTVIVDDITAPVPDVASLPTVTEECSASVTAPTATDNCVGPVTATTTDPTSYPAQGTYTITWTYNDGNGNTSSQTQTVIVDDITAPVADVASLPTVTGECGATVTAPTATDNCVGSVTATTSDATSFTTQGTFTINWTYNDGNGNTSGQTQTVVIDDITAPVPDVASLPVITGECSAAVIAAPTATDNCVGSVTATTTDPTSYTAQGTYTITWTYNDGNGNTSSQTQTVIVDDITAPVADVASLPTVTGECSATVTAPTATDNCVGTVTGTTSDPTSYTAQGTYTITWTYNDGNGNTSSQTQTVIVDDITAPVADVASLPTLTGQCSVTATAPTATDNCEGPITGTTADPLIYSTDGTYTITWTYDDGNGNTSSQTQTVIVDDITAPVPDVASLPTITGECNAAVTAPTATDNCEGTITATTTDPLSYSVDGTYTITWTYDDGRGNTSSQTQTVIVDDITAPVPNVASLPTVTGECGATVTAPTAMDNCAGPITATTSDATSFTTQGTFTINWTYNDGNGNTSGQVQTVIVDDITAPVADVASLPTVTGECGATVTAPTATDNCVGSVTATTSDATSFTTQGTFTINWTYNDGNGNTSGQTQTVVIDDITAPVPDVASLPVITGECSAAVIAAPTATDNCVGSVTATTTDPTSYTAQGTYTITWTYNDGNGNTSSQTQTVIVDDITAPVADVASLPTVTGECSATVTAPTATDNCVGTVTGTTSDPTSYTAQGTYTITWTYNDGNGNTSSQTQTVIVDDITAPVADVASLPTLTGQCSVTATAPTATDNCEGPITGTTADPLTYSTDGTYTITWTYDDGNGNTSSQTQTVIVDDITAPVPDVASLPTITGECNAAVTAPTATDNCEGTITATTTDPLSYSVDGTYTITWTYDDGRGNTSSQTQTVIVDDITAPVPNVASLPTVTGECGATVTAPTAMDNCAGPITATTSDATSFTTQGTFTINWTYNDGNGNTSGQVQTVIVDDITAPVADVASLPTVTGECGATVTAPTATDNCVGSVTATTSDATSFTTQGTFTINWTYNDGNGNTSGQTQTVVIDDITAPVPDVASLPVITGECSAAVIAAPTATDNCVGSVTAITTDPTSYTLQGTYTITWTYNDGNGNTSSQTQTVIVDDITAPVADVASLPTVTGECSATVTAPTATDNCVGTVTGTTSDPTSYTAQGTYTITWTYNDGNGNTSSQTQTVVVDDITAPVADVASLPTITGECGVTVTAPTATDNCVGAVVGTTSDPLTYSVDGTYTITWTYDDGNGNTSSQTQTVIVDDITAPVADVASLPTVTGECSAAVTAPTATDNCVGAVTATTTDPTSYTTQGTFTITWTYNDGNGNTSSQTQTVIVDDITAPVPNMASLPTVTGECGATVIAPTAMDNCVGAVTATTTDPTSFTTQGTFTINWTYNDGNGNTSGQTQTVIVDDITGPVADVASLPTVTGECSATVTAPTATDNCVGSLTATTTDPTSYSAQGTYTITWTYNDGNGNTSSQTQTVIVDDITAPTASNPAPIAVQCMTNVPAPDVSVVTDESDNCGTATVTFVNDINNGGLGSIASPYIVTRTYSISDGNGNSSTVTQTITVIDNTNPVVTCPANKSISLPVNVCSTTYTLAEIGNATATDNCSIPTITWVRTDPGGVLNNQLDAPFSVGLTSIAWTATDAAGNKSTCIQTITVNGAAPTITAPADVTVSVNANSCFATGVALGTPTTTGCGSLAINNNAPAQFPVGVTLVTWAASDGVHLVFSGTQKVTVVDNIAPTITCPADMIMELLPNQCSMAVGFGAAATDNCGTPTVTYIPASGSVFQIGTTTVTAKATDASGNFTTCTFTVTVKDVTAPIVSCPANVNVAAATGQCSAVVNYPAATATDNCSTPTISYSIPPGSTFPIGTTTVTVTATDAAGLTDICTFTVTVTDSELPQISCPAAINVTAAVGECGAIVNFTAPVGTDNCGTPVTTQTAGLPSGSVFPIGTTTNTYLVTDAGGNTSTCSFTVTVNDTELPTITCQSPINVNNDLNACGAVINYTAPVGADNCTGAVTIQTAGLPSGSLFPIGTTTNTFEVTDASGNTATCSFTVTVTDTQLPTITGPTGNTMYSVDLGTCGASVGYTIDFADNCPGATVQQTAGLASFAIFPIGTTTNTFVVTDASGNTATHTFMVTVTDNEAPVINCPSNITVGASVGQCGAIVNYTAPVGTDNCSGAVTTQTAGLASGSVFPTGTTVNTFSVTDAAGNTTTCSFNVTVTDDIAPSISCPASISVSATTGQCGAVVNYLTPVGTDNCSGAVTTQTAGLASGSMFPTGTTVNTFSVTDAAGNTTTCSFNVTVTDDIAPVITCPGNITVNTAGLCGAVVNYATPVGTDNCAGAVTTRTAGLASGMLFPVGTTTVTYMVTDASSNAVSCSFTVTVTDDENPVPAAASLTTVTGSCTATVSTTPTANDNCGVITGTTTDPLTYNTPGTYTITWKYTDASGNFSTQTQTVVVNSSPATINAAPQSTVVCEGQPATFTASAVGSIQWQVNTGSSWVDISGAITSTLNIPSATISMNGYQYRVVVTGACGNATSSAATLTVNALPSLFTVNGGGSFCSGPGVLVGLSGSQSGTSYQLLRNGSPIGSAVSGTGSAISFGNQNLNGTYTVVATRNTCPRTMTGSVMVSAGTAPNLFTVTGGGTGCNGSGYAVGLSGSQTGVSYQLLLGSVPAGSPVAGTGSAITFGLQTMNGLYFVQATHTASSCTASMTGSATVAIGATPTAFNVTGGGSFCSGVGVPVGLSGTQTGVNYQLKRGGSLLVTTVAGTGGAISFGNQNINGTYTVVAVNSTTGCTNNMTGSAIISSGALPTLYTVSITGNGYICGTSGPEVLLSGSQTGVNYQLVRGASNVGSPMAGTGSPLNFGSQTAAGYYSVVATSTPGNCTRTMTGSPAINQGVLPTAYNVTGGGAFCSGPGVEVGLANSQTNVSYQLTRTVGSTTTNVGSPVNGSNGAYVSFGFFNTPGTYKVVGTNVTTGCSKAMSNAATISQSVFPIVYNVTGGGSYCTGGTAPTIGLSSSQNFVAYQLKRTVAAVTTNVGSPVPGTGSAISFGSQTVAGVYTVVGYYTNISGCEINMNSSATISNTGSLPATSINYPGNPFCQTGSVNVNRTGQTGGTYTSGAGLSINASTGAINLAASSAGTYTVTYSYSNGACSSTATTSVTISAAPTATIAYAGSPYCKFPSATGSVTRTGQAGGTYTASPAGLSINASTGAINLGASTIGTYTVTYTFSNGGSCIRTATAIVSVVDPPAATISYAGSPYCQGGFATVTRTGTGAGTFSSTAGLSINATTGQINIAASSVGTYVVTYTFSNRYCSNTATATVVINGNVPLSISCPANLTNVSTNAGLCYATGVNLGTPTVTGSCGATVTNNAPAQFPIGNTIVTWTATRGAFTATCTQTVTVKDNQNPVGNTPSDQTFCKSSNNLYTLAATTATDNCGVPTISYTITGATSRSGTNGNASGLFNVGSSQINWVVSDTKGNTITKTTTVIVSNCVTGTRPQENEVTMSKIPNSSTLGITIAAFPNPSQHHFNVKVNSTVKETVEVRMFDLQGRVVEIKRGAPDQIFRFGDNAAAGMYIIEARQSGVKEKAEIKVVKGN